MFGTSRLYLGAAMVADVLERHPGLRVELVGQNSEQVLAELRRGRLSAAMVAIPVVDDTMTVRPVARDELVYVSADPDRAGSPVTPKRLSEAQLVLTDVTYREVDSVRRALSAWLQRDGRTVAARIEVEDVETALELVARGLADTVVPKGVVTALRPTLASGLHAVSLRPRVHETIAVVHRPDAVLSPATRLVIDLASSRVRQVAEPI
jgi:DNA-binding transcriptional LysR family regulator